MPWPAPPVKTTTSSRTGVSATNTTEAITRRINICHSAGGTSRLAVQRRLHPLRRERHGAQPHAGGVIDRVGERGADRGAGGLARAERRFARPVDQIDFEFWRIGEAED